MMRTSMALKIIAFLLGMNACYLTNHNVLLQAAATNVDSSGNDNFIVAGYLPEYRFYININNTALQLTDLILFSVEPFGTSFIQHLQKHHYQQAREAKAYKQEQQQKENGSLVGDEKLKLWLSVGGAGLSDEFSHICTTLTKRQKFIQNLITLCQEEGLDGIDFDWEVPKTQQEFSSYMKLLKEASIAFHQVNLLVSVATRHLDLLPSYVLQEIDRIHFMGYDLLEQPQSGISQHHADLARVKNMILHTTPTSASTQQKQSQQGFPTWTHEQQQKLILGIPMYARHGYNPQKVLTFAELIDKSKENGGTIDAIIQSSTGEWNGWRYDSPKLVQEKIAWVSANNLGGVFFWELGQDKQIETIAPGGVILKEAYTAKMIMKKKKENGESSEPEL